MTVKIDIPTLSTSKGTSDINDNEGITQEDITNCKKVIKRIQDKLITEEDKDYLIPFTNDDISEFAKTLESKLSEFHILIWRSAPIYEKNSKCVEICNLILDADFQIIQKSVDITLYNIIIILERSLKIILSFAPSCAIHRTSSLEKMISYFNKLLIIEGK